jgi:hypothetical protein
LLKICWYTSLLKGQTLNTKYKTLP